MRHFYEELAQGHLTCFDLNETLNVTLRVNAGSFTYGRPPDLFGLDQSYDVKVGPLRKINKQKLH